MRPPPVLRRPRDPPCKWDIVLCLWLLYHTEDPVWLFRKMAEHCSAEGMIIIDTVFYDKSEPGFRYYAEEASKIGLGIGMSDGDRPILAGTPSFGILKLMAKHNGLKFFSVLPTYRTRGVFHFTR